EGKQSGSVHIANGHLKKVQITHGNGKVKGNSFQLSSESHTGILIEVDSVKNKYGSDPTVISLKTANNPFSFFLRDVTEISPIYLSDYGVVVLNSSDTRSYEEIEKEVLSRKLLTKIQQIDRQTETSFVEVE